MPSIPRQVKPPARVAITCKLPEHTAALLRRYTEFLDSTQEYVVNEVLDLTFRRDREFQTWLAAHPVVTSPHAPATTSPIQGDESVPAGRAQK